MTSMIKKFEKKVNECVDNGNCDQLLGIINTSVSFMPLEIMVETVYRIVIFCGSSSMLEYVLTIPMMDPSKCVVNPLINCIIGNNNTIWLEKLLKDGRTDPMKKNNEHDCEFVDVFKTALAYNNVQAVQLLLEDGRVNPNKYIITACRAAHYDIVEMMSVDPRINMQDIVLDALKETCKLCYKVVDGNGSRSWCGRDHALIVDFLLNKTDVYVSKRECVMILNNVKSFQNSRNADFVDKAIYDICNILQGYIA